jgi:hypothetical protein
VRAGTRLRQRDKTKANITHGDDTEAKEPPQHTAGGGDSTVMREGVRAGTQLRQRDKAKATVPHGDDAEAQEPPQPTQLEVATSQRCGEREDTQLRQCVKAKATIPHGDDAEAQESPQHTVGGGSAAMRKSVRTLSSYNATKPRRQSYTVVESTHRYSPTEKFSLLITNHFSSSPSISEDNHN